MEGKFTASFESLRNYKCPEWFRDVKFGIWSHWGPQSVPMCGDWYARNMYVQGSPQNLYHVRHYGHPSEFGYKDIVKLWKAEKFNPDELMELYYRAGARYFVAQATHHDHFFNYGSKINRFNSVKMGPNKDICRMWKDAAKKYKLPFGITEHLAASFSWWYTNKGSDSYGPYKGVPYDGNLPEYADFYYDNQEYYKPDLNGKLVEWTTGNEKFQKYWFDCAKEMIDALEPDLLYSDSGLPFCDKGYKYGLEMLSYLYNSSIDRNGMNQIVYTQKIRDPEVYKVGTLDIEKSQLPKIFEDPWQTDTCIGNWFYDAKQEYKKPGHIIEMLVDIISKNGTMLLNVLQKPDGTIDAEARYILEEIGKWFDVCSEGVYGTRPFRIYCEGKTEVIIKEFTEDKTEWSSSDFRFTKKGNVLYAFMMKAPENGEAVLKSLLPEERVKGVRLLGAGEVPFAQTFSTLVAKLPEKLPTDYVNCLAIEMCE